ncbi:phage Gp19/Gp15/Gp42 family protein [Sporosarcina sp. 6E9]|uniref:phage Gp19/Gp15/Gp42 family protein n=1 Tax=Sporosarcina sp. 6E9 TaxID=2819235 RepID=UPI001AC9D555|nr:phage Gp19/Gp15/Gp42 family protein [Sporosarcina sp. 6E9]MBO1910070.1 phage Gp19/Gp15/Gp42 family protein [Microvirga sp. 3-52]
MADFATINELITLWRPLQQDEETRAEALLTVVSDRLRLEAENVGKDIDEMIADSVAYKSVVKSVTVDIVARTLMTSTNQEPMKQYSESALGYSVSGTFLTPGGGLFIKRDELKALGLRKQRYGVIDFYGTN